MIDEDATGPQGRTARVRFTGSRTTMFGILFRGMLLMLPTLGIYRFWLVTAKRRFLWAHTEIDGDPLEYTGTAKQLLIGFLFALMVFLPLYGLFFYLSTTSREVAMIGYAVVAILIYFLGAYALYRARRFRLTRTLWRGIRFGQGGNAWVYALRSFGWSILMVLTLGLIHPFMAANLWRYRYRNTWYGDRQFGFTGTWRTVAGPYYLSYFIAALFVAILVGMFINLMMNGGLIEDAPPVDFILGIGVTSFLIVSLAFFYHTREVTRFYSSVTVGAARLRTRLGARRLFVLYVIYSVALGVATFVFLALIFALIGVFAGDAVQTVATIDSPAELGAMLAGSYWVLIVVIILYLAMLGTYSILAELIIGLGYWKMLADNAEIENADDLRTVRALGEESPILGEGLADALNVGAY